MAFCLPKEFTTKFVDALKEGKIVPEKLIEMSSEERRNFLKDIVGEADAKDVNALLESKLILKDQKRGMVSWAKKVGGITETVRADMITKIEKMNKILDVKNQQVFLEDLASKKLGIDISFEEAKKLAEISSSLAELKTKLGTSEEARLAYGAKKVEMQNYVNELKLSNSHTTFKENLQNIKTNPVQGAIKGVSDLAGIAKGIKASLDDSALFRQGWKTLFTNPSIWAKNAFDSFSNIYNQLKLKPTDSKILDGIKADIYSRPNAVDGTYNKMKLDIGDMEEAFPTTLPEKIPLFGRLYKASEVAYTGFLYRMRADIADKYVEIAKGNGIDLTDKLEIESIGRLVNSLTGRGSLGSFEKVGKQVNTIFFSPKMVKSSFDFLTLHAGDKMSVFARKQATINLLKVASGMAVILGTAKALNPNSVELDTRSSDFGKIRIGDTRFDVSGGMSSMITLASRLLENSSKSSISGKITPLNSGKFGSQTSVDVFKDYLTNKLSPLASVVKDLLNRTDFQGKPITLQGEASNLLVPLPITNIDELLKNPNSANVIIAEMADALGIVTNTYSKKK